MNNYLGPKRVITTTNADVVWVFEVSVLMAHTVQAYRLYPEEREFFHRVIDKVFVIVQAKDMKVCVACALDIYKIDVEVHNRGDAFLREVVQNAISKKGTKVFGGLMKRLPAYVRMTPALRGKILLAKAKQLGLPQRTQWVRVDTNTLKEECLMASSRTKMKMSDARVRECRQL